MTAHAKKHDIHEAETPALTPLAQGATRTKYSLEKREACREFMLEFRKNNGAIHDILLRGDGADGGPHSPLTDAECHDGLELLQAYRADSRIEEFLTRP